LLIHHLTLPSCQLLMKSHKYLAFKYWITLMGSNMIEELFLSLVNSPDIFLPRKWDTNTFQCVGTGSINDWLYISIFTDENDEAKLCDQALILYHVKRIRKKIKHILFTRYIICMRLNLQSKTYTLPMNLSKREKKHHQNTLLSLLKKLQ
jgi:hypothetical protein